MGSQILQRRQNVCQDIDIREVLHLGIFVKRVVKRRRVIEKLFFYQLAKIPKIRLTFSITSWFVSRRRLVVLVFESFPPFCLIFSLILVSFT